MFVALLGAALGCGGYSTEKAELRCDQEESAKEQCVTDAAYEACVACYEECGAGCHPGATCPETYLCGSSNNADDSSDDTSADQ
ncbi:MAG: hypothetical protein R3B70_39695 [Polyangiaceae bacterium]